MTVFGGDEILAADLNVIELEATRLGEIAYGNRASNKTFTGGAETGVLRVDNIALVGGRSYSIRVPQLRTDFATSTDKVAYRLRASTSGAATTASATIAQCEAGDQQTGSMESIRHPATDETLSVILTALQYVGSSAAVLQADGVGMTIEVEDLGPAVSDTGVDL